MIANRKSMYIVFALFIVLSMLLSACGHLQWVPDSTATPKATNIEIRLNGKPVTYAPQEFDSEDERAAILKIACAAGLSGVDFKNGIGWVACSSEPTKAVVSGDTTGTITINSTPAVVVGGVPAAAATMAPTQASAATTPAAVLGLDVYSPFTPDWGGLSDKCPSRAEVLKMHNLTEDMLQPYTPKNVSWEPCQHVFELRPDLYGKVTIPLLNGGAYTLAPVQSDAMDMWGGDARVKTANLQWGFTFRWGPTYVSSRDGAWLNPNNACEWLVRDARFGLYWRNLTVDQTLNLPDVPYFGRVGPYKTLPGNVSCPGWIPPEPNQVIAQNYLQAAAMYGGRAIESDWLCENGNCRWRHSEKGVKGADAKPHYWQSAYIPGASTGCVMSWRVKGQIGPNGVAVTADGPYKFFSKDIGYLLLYSDDEHSFNVICPAN